MSLSELPTPEKFSEHPAKVLARPVMNWREKARMFSVLFKSRVVSLLLLAAVGGAFLAEGGWPGFGVLLLVLVTGGLAASGSERLPSRSSIRYDGARALSKMNSWISRLGASPMALTLHPLG
jgi:hypothetical protein